MAGPRASNRCSTSSRNAVARCYKNCATRLLLPSLDLLERVFLRLELRTLAARTAELLRLIFDRHVGSLGAVGLDHHQALALEDWPGIDLRFGPRLALRFFHARRWCRRRRR